MIVREDDGRSVDHDGHRTDLDPGVVERMKLDRIDVTAHETDTLAVIINTDAAIMMNTRMV